MEIGGLFGAPTAELGSEESPDSHRGLVEKRRALGKSPVIGACTYPCALGSAASGMSVRGEIVRSVFFSYR